MIIDRINTNLTEKGFRSIRVNVNGVYVHFRESADSPEKGYFIVMVLDCPKGNEFTPEQYGHIRSQIYDNFLNKGEGTVRILGILCTENTERARTLYSDSGGEQWIIDTKNGRLILYEDQRGDFLGLRKDIEAILFRYGTAGEEDGSVYHGSTEPDYRSDRTADRSVYGGDGAGYASDDETERYPGGNTERKSFVKSYFTKCNTLLVIINVMIFFWLDIGGSSQDTRSLLRKGALYWPYIEQYGEYYRIVTYMFLHSGFEHLANNMVVLLFVGDNLERAIGKWRYLLIYFACGVIAGIVSLSYNILNGTNVVSVGASGAIFGVVGALAYIVILNKGRLEDLSSRQIILFVIFSLYGGLTSQGVDNAAHIGGLIAGVIIAAILYRRPNRYRTEGDI